MKRLLSKIFFVSDCARGMLFALTLVTVGNYLWFSRFYLFLLWNGKTSWLLILLKDEDRLLWIPALVALPITLYSLALAVVALVGLTQKLRRGRRFKSLICSRQGCASRSERSAPSGCSRRCTR